MQLAHAISEPNGGLFALLRSRHYFQLEMVVGLRILALLLLRIDLRSADRARSLQVIDVERRIQTCGAEHMT